MTILIKKEKDNKLYDTSLKKYIKLLDILNYIKKSQSVKIIDCHNKDITENTLVAIMFYEKDSLILKKDSLLDFIKLASIKTT